ncbi:transposase [Streptomyces sp. NPDC048419]|uniref:transposase n=1 Tax=Streptomyces sp. NPDC048419 TaxID=3365547 RepID=UPI00371F3554
MTLSQSELIQLLESLRRADGVEAIRVVCERILQELIEAEATDVIGAAPGEHSDKRTTWRNGHRGRGGFGRAPGSVQAADGVPRWGAGRASAVWW